jgi:hypothetical protein
MTKPDGYCYCDDCRADGQSDPAIPHTPGLLAAERPAGDDRRRWQCVDCPFTTNDPEAAFGHEHGPRRGWLGDGRQHTLATVEPWTDEDTAELAAAMSDAAEAIRDRHSEARAGGNHIRHLGQPEAETWRDCDRANREDSATGARYSANLHRGIVANHNGPTERTDYLDRVAAGRLRDHLAAAEAPVHPYQYAVSERLADEMADR